MRPSGSGRPPCVFIERIEAIEHDVFGLPRADVTLLLDLSLEHARRLVAKKAQRSYTDRTADLYEAEAGYLDSVRAVYHDLSADTRTWRIIPCERGGELRTIQAIAEDVFLAATA